jgi:hypothetical protein
MKIETSQKKIISLVVSIFNNNNHNHNHKPSSDLEGLISDIHSRIGFGGHDDFHKDLVKTSKVNI